MAESCPVELDFHDSTSLQQHYQANALVDYVNSWPRFGFPKELPVSLFLSNDDGNNGNGNDDDELALPFYLTGIFMWSSIFSSLLIMYILILLAYNSHQAFSRGRQREEEALQPIDRTGTDGTTRAITNSTTRQATGQQNHTQQNPSLHHPPERRSVIDQEQFFPHHPHNSSSYRPHLRNTSSQDPMMEVQVETNDDIESRMHGPEAFKAQHLQGNSDHKQDLRNNSKGDSNHDVHQQQLYNRLDTEQILRHLQATDNPSLATLPQSQFVSPSVSRKRLLEAYFESIMNTSTMLKLGYLFQNDDDGENNEDEARRQPPNERHPPVATTTTRHLLPPPPSNEKPPRQRWTFSQVFESPRQEDDDGSTLQPPKKKQQARTQDDEASINNTSLDSRRRRNNIQDETTGQFHPDHPATEFVPSMEEDGGDNISPRTAATASSGSDSSSDPQRAFTYNKFKRLRSSSAVHQEQQQRPAANDNSDDDDSSCFQMLTLFAGFMLLLFIILLCSDGLVPLGIQSDAMIQDWQTLMFSSLETKQILNNVQQVESSLYDRSNLLYQALDKSCPAVKTSLCTQEGEGYYSCNLRGIPLHEDWEMLLDMGIQKPTNITTPAHQDETRRTTSYNWTLAHHDLTTLTTIPFESSMNVWKWILRVAGICNALLFVLILLVVWSIAIPKRRQFAILNKFVCKSRAFLWLFWIATLCVWMVAIASLAGTFVLSDFCVESPTDYASEVLLFGNNNSTNNNAAGGQSFLSQEFWKYHIDGCPAEEYPDSFQPELQKWLNLWGPTKNLHDALQRIPTAQFELICGGGIDNEDGRHHLLLHDLQLATSHFQSEMCSLVQTLMSLRRVLECSRWYPPFQSIIYKSVCDYGIHGVGWTALAEWIIVVMSLTVWTFDFWRSPSSTNNNTAREPIHGIPPGRRIIHKQQQKQRLEDDRLGKFPVASSGSTTAEASFVRERQTPIILHGPPPDPKRIPTNNQTDFATFAQLPEVSAHPVVEEEMMKRLPLDPPASDATFSEDEDTFASEAWGGSQSQAPPDADSTTQSREIERTTGQVANDEGLDLYNREHNETFAPKNIPGATRHDMNDTLPVPRPTTGNGTAELAESSLFQAEGDSREAEEEDLCSL